MTDFWERKPVTIGGYTALGLVALGLFVMRLSGPPDLMDNAQERPAAYVLDVTQNGNWLCQRDATGDITSKPPLYTWLAALAAIAVGRLNLFTLCLPAALSTLALAWLIYGVGRVYFGGLTALLAGLVYLLSFVSSKQVALARTDGLFSLTVTVATLLAFRAWRMQRGWTWFWVAAAAATLTKGPLGVLLAAGGLLAAAWEWRSGCTLPVKGSHLLGIALFLLIAGGWFALAYRKMGTPLIDKMIKQEMMVEAMSNGRNEPLIKNIYKPFLYFLARFAPWSLLSCIGFWRTARSASEDSGLRRFERFLFCWFFVGLLIFSLSSHQRGDLLWPLMPAAALCAGRELGRLVEKRKPAEIIASIVVVTAIIFLGFIFFYKRTERTNAFVKRTIAMEEFAATVRESVGEDFPLTHMDEPFTFQFYLGPMRRLVSFDRAAELLRGEAAAFVLVSDLARLKEHFGTDTHTLHELARWPATGEPLVRIVSNHPRLEWTEHMAFLDGALHVQVDDARTVHVSEHELGFRSAGNHSTVTITNKSEQPRRVRARLIQDTSETVDERVLAKEETLRVSHE